MLSDDIFEVEEFFARCGNMHLQAFERIKTALVEAQKQSTASNNTAMFQLLCDIAHKWVNNEYSGVYKSDDLGKRLVAIVAQQKQ